MQPQTRDAGFLDFLKSRAPTPSRSNPLSRFLNPDVIEDFLKSKTHMNITGVSVKPLGFGVSLTVSVYEDRPINRTRTLESAMAPMVNVIGDYLGAPVKARVSLDTNNPLFDPTEGQAIYEITIKTDYPTETARNASAGRVADGFMARMSATEETTLTLDIKGSRVVLTLKGPQYRKIQEMQRITYNFLASSNSIYLKVTPSRFDPSDTTGTFSMLSGAGAVYGEVNRKPTQQALKSLSKECVAHGWCDRILMGDGDDVTAILTAP